MLKKLILTLSILFLLGSAPLTQASNHFKVFDFSSGANFFDNKAHWPQQLLLKSGVPYDESKDPALRQGTENWEESQGSFFIVPALVLGVIGLVLFFNRN